MKIVRCAFRLCYVFVLLAFLGIGTEPLDADTVVKLGSVTQIFGPQDLDLEGNIVYAINFSATAPSLIVRGVTFLPDNKPIPGATLVGSQNVVGWQNKPEFGSTADDDALEEILHDIRWADAGSNQRLKATLTVTAGEEYKLQILISGNTSENRIWDIRINAQEAVGEITSLGVSPGQSYSSGRATLYTYQFRPAASAIVVEMGNLFGSNDGGDRNPIWQALTLEKISVPPAPDDIMLDSSVFFANQIGPVGHLQVIDQKSGTSHVLEFVSGDGDTDNAKFTISGSDLLPSPFDFSNEPEGSNYSIRVRATDATDATRFLEKTFALLLSKPHPPSVIKLDAAALDSFAEAGMLVANLSADDPDPLDRHTFELIAGEGSDDNALFIINGSELRLAKALPRNVAQARFRVRATDLSGLSVENALVLAVIPRQVVISELIATEVNGVLDEKKQPQEWIELRNALPEWVDLSGSYLTDNANDLAKWKFPSGLIPPNGFVVILADGLGVAPAGSTNLHANFSLDATGEWLGLVRSDGSTIASQLTVPAMFPGVSYGIGSDGNAGYLKAPTPGKANGATSEFGENEVIFSQPHGFYTNAFSLELTATVPDSVIRYTLDGSRPTVVTGTIYSGPINVAPNSSATIRGTRIVRAIAVSSRAAYAGVKSQTYLFVNGSAGPTFDGVVGQSQLKTTITRNPAYAPLMSDAFLALPAVSVILPSGPNATERLGSVELLDPAGQEEGFQIDCGIEATGTTSLSSPKLSMAAKFRSKYGLSKLKYPVFARGSMLPEGAATEFKELRLRSHSHDTFFWLGTRENPPVPYGSPPVRRSGDAQLVRNPWIDEMQLFMGQPGKHGRQVHLFLNGVYNGIYHVHEHPDEDFMASYYPGTSDDYHSTAAATGGSIHGTGDSWTVPWKALHASLGNFSAAKRWVDMTNLCDYMLLSFYAGNDWDWSSQHNWSAAGPRFADKGGWKFFEQDSDVSLQDVSADCTDQDVPDGIFTALMRLADFKVLFRDRVYKHCFNDGMLTPAKAGGLYDARMNEISTAIVAESARWQPSSSIATLPWDRDQEWTNEWKYFRDTFFPKRTTNLLAQLRRRTGWWPFDPPELSHSSGTVPAGYSLSFTAKLGSIYYTTDGSDPRQQGGAANPAAVKISSGATLTIDAAIHILARIFSGTDWSALVEASLVPDNIMPASASNLVISEIQYHPLDQSGNEFIELLNTSAAPLDLSDFSLSQGVVYRFPRPTVLAAGERIAVAKDMALFAARYQTVSSPYYRQGVRVLGPWEGSLANDGETIVVQAPDGSAIFSCAYGTTGDWPGRADGKGSSLELIDPSAAPLITAEKTIWLDDPLNWRASSEFHGSPGAAGLGPDTRVLINEILAASIAPDTDAIELKDNTAVAVDLSGWFLSDSSDDYRKYRFADGAQIQGGAWLVLRETDFNNVANPNCLAPFVLDSAGGDLYLIEGGAGEALLRFADRIKFGPAANGISIGRWPDGTGPLFQLRDPTLGLSNSPPLSGYENWAAAIFPVTTPATDTARTADPDGDGFSNLVEYAFVLSPLETSASPLAVSAPATDNPFSFSYRTRTDAPELRYRVDTSLDLVTWDQTEAQVETLKKTEQSDGSTLVTARLRPATAVAGQAAAVAGQAATTAYRFVRVVVSEQQ
jgi:hypothetical protein